jgi:hypothetical protein
MRRTDSKEDGQREEFDLNKFRESMHFFYNVRVWFLAPTVWVDTTECFQLVGTEYQRAGNKERMSEWKKR